MRITFLGGSETVTGSKFLVETKQVTILVDCGLFQGFKWLRKRNWQELPLDLSSIDAIVLTHAHLDHSGYIPVLYKKGFRGPVYTQKATVDLCAILLADSGHLQEEDARYYTRHKIGRHAHPEPLYDRAMAEECMALFKPVEFEETVDVGGVRFYFQPAGHILGAASVIMEAEEKCIGFSGDVGRANDIFMHPPKPLPALDLLLLESTYGNRLHGTADPYAQLANVVNNTVKQGGVLLIPSFAVGRAQLLQHMLATLMTEGSIPKLPVYLDSPMAIDVSDIYCRYMEQHKLNLEQCKLKCSIPTYTRTVDESKAIANQVYPHIIIAGSGMASGGRILHHFKRLIGDTKTTVMFTGYQAGGTRGAKMISGANSIRIHGEWFPVRAGIEMLEGLSGHGDYLEIEQWLKQSALAAGTEIQLVHGEPEALEAMRDHLRQHTSFSVEVAGYKSILHL